MSETDEHRSRETASQEELHKRMKECEHVWIPGNRRILATAICRKCGKEWLYR